MDEGSHNVDEPVSWDQLYNINLIPSQLFFKFRKEIQGIRVGANLEVCNAPINDCRAKLVVKPLSPEQKWKFMLEPITPEIQILSKKIPVTDFLNLQLRLQILHLRSQVGICHNFRLNAFGWKWKLTTCLGGDGVSRIRNKARLGLRPGVEFRFGWRADYVIPEISGSVGSKKGLLNVSSGRLQASLDRVEAVFTASDFYLEAKETEACKSSKVKCISSS